MLDKYNKIGVIKYYCLMVEKGLRGEISFGQGERMPSYKTTKFFNFALI